MKEFEGDKYYYGTMVIGTLYSREYTEWLEEQLEDLNQIQKQSEVLNLKQEKTDLKPIQEELQKTKDERETMINAFVAFRKEFEGRDWIIQGRGPYTYDDEGYQKEVEVLFDTFKSIERDMWKGIESKTFEYKNEIKKPLLDRIKLLEEVLDVAVKYLLPMVGDDSETGVKINNAINNKIS